MMDKSRQSFLNDIICAVTTRFEGDLNLFNGSSFLKFSAWPAELTEDLADFEDSNISELVTVCTPALRESDPDTDTDSIEPEWTRLKTELYNSKMKIHTLTWPSLHSSHAKKYPNFFHLVEYMLSLPSSSVDAERGFSRMKMIKNDWRSKLGDRHLSDLILINLEVPSITEFDPTSAIQQWNAGGTRVRRPFFNDDSKSRVSTILHSKAASEKLSIYDGAEVHEADAEAEYNDVFLMAEMLDTDTQDNDSQGEYDDYFHRDQTLLQQ